MKTLMTQSSKPELTTVSRSPSVILQRKCDCGQHTIAGGECGACNKDRDGTMQRSAISRAPGGGADIGVPAIVHDVLRSPGQPLDAATRAFFEPRFGHDFSRVRLHTDARASESAQAVNALAYTVGPDIVFRAGQYSAGSAAGNRLMAHELAHVLQQENTVATVQTQLQVGPPQDSAEIEADNLADQVMNASVGTAPTPLRIGQTPLIVRRQLSSADLDAALAGAPATQGPQRVGETRMVTLPTIHRGESEVVPHVIRSLTACPCRQVPEIRDGAFWNPELDNFAIAYRHCQGQRSVDVYARLQSNLSDVLASGAGAEGTLRAGGVINVAGRSVQGNVLLEAVGTNEPAGTSGTTGAVPGGTPGVGGHAQAVIQGSTWRIFLDAEYVRRLGSLPGGADPNQWTFRLGGEHRGVSASGGCTSGGGVTTCTINVGIPLGPTARTERCFTCFCPPPTREYHCIDFERDRDTIRPTVVETHPAEEFRVYFQVDSSTVLERTLSDESNANLSRMAAQVRSGGTIEYIAAYASPETTERHNQTLSEGRARQMTEIVRQHVASDVQVPEGFGGGELLGNRPTASPSSRVGDVITRNGFRSAEDLSIALSGDEIPNAELAAQFLSLFNALPEPADRLAIFGLAENDPIAGQILTAIDRFVRNRGRGRRPWDPFFRLLRVGVVRVRSTVRTPGTESVHVRGDTTEPSNEECRRRGERAEAMTPGFGPIDRAAIHPVATPEQSLSDCDNNPPLADDIRRGCSYETARSSGRRPSAPDIAPTPFGQSSSGQP
jgi:hypothetical protein